MTTDDDGSPNGRKLFVDTRKLSAYDAPMVRTFKHKGLAELWATGRTAKIDAKLQARILRRLDALESAVRPEDLNLPGFDFHSLKGFDPTRYTVHVNGPWAVTFAWDGVDALAVDLENYH